jgi:NADPH-dependent 2,4-dienoyl-CoA reductase/sulfur reductase-like enzyme/rhodanese-related sulfurtransferase
MKIVIIGGVAAGLKAASKARRCNPQAEITVVEKGDLISYGACGLPYYVGGEVAGIQELMQTPAGALRTPEYFQNIKDLKILTRTLAYRINRDQKQVFIKNLDSGEESLLPYDKLVIATGAYPIKPNLPGVELSNIFQLWHPRDAEKIRRGLEQGRFENVVIIGAGLVGMELASALTIWGVNVSVIEMKGNIFSNFLDEEMAENVENYLRSQGVQLFTGEKVIGFTGDAAVSAVKTDKREIPADAVVMALGVRPNTELAGDAGIVLGTTGAIAVNESLQTSDPDIYAGGDCVENTNLVSGLKVFAPMGSLANRHGRIIGENLFGNKRRFKGILNTVVVKVGDFTVGKTGITECEAKALGYDYVTVITAGHDKLHYMEDAKVITIKLIADSKSRKVLGIQAYGPGEVAKRIDVVAAVLTIGGTLEDLTDIDLSYAPPYNSPIDNVAVAANVLMNKLEGNFKGISPVMARERMQDHQTVFLDVRTDAEYKQERLAQCTNMKHIPLGELRSRSKELNKNDKIITFCKISLRGYEAEGILEGQDFKQVMVLEGGLVSWPFGHEK